MREHIGKLGTTCASQRWATRLHWRRRGRKRGGNDWNCYSASSNATTKESRNHIGLTSKRCAKGSGSKLASKRVHDRVISAATRRLHHRLSYRSRPNAGS